MKLFETIVEIVPKILQVSEPVVLKIILYLIFVYEAVRFLIWVLLGP